MKVVKTKHITSAKPVSVIDCFVDSGFLQGAGGSLPDVDVDYQSDRRQEVKEYIERRYNHDGKQRVFSAGTFTTLKVKAVIKDVARTMLINPSFVNYLTALFDDDKCDYTGIFKLAAENKKIAKFIHDYPMLFEDIRMDLVEKKVFRGNTYIHLGPTEFRLLKMLMETPGKVFSREFLLKNVLPYSVTRNNSTFIHEC